MITVAYSKSQLKRRQEDLAGHTEIAEASTFAEVHDERIALVANALVPLKSPEQAVENISHLWKEAQDKFIAIGRYLIEAKRKFPKAYEKEVVERLPFGRQVAFQLSTVAKAVDAGVFRTDELPRTYSAAYLLTTLDGEELAEARHYGLLHPDVRRREIEAFKKSLERRRLEHQGRRALLKKCREDLRDRVARLREQLDHAERELQKVEAAILQDQDGLVVEGVSDSEAV